VAEAVIGSGEGGLADGAYDEAAFDHPHGLAIDGDRLYVADTGNHAVRVVDLATERVDTLLGSGEQARRFNVPGRGREVALNSPWDLLVLDGALYIAMAGSHQLWRADLSTLECAPWAGSGAEALFDAPLLGAALAQPSGLAAAGGKLFFADSESSAIRRADLAPGGSVGTVVGTGLFDFGDQDGAGDEVRLQHPLALAWRDGRLLVADSYNNKVKIVDPTDRTATSWLGGAGELWEPGGLAVAGGRLYIADTNHHRVVVASLAGAEMEALVVRGV
jgi:DNA-binding beta-propeller fold protein YncE